MTETTTKTNQETTASRAVVKYQPQAIAGSPHALKALVTSESFIGSVREMAPKHLSPERLVRMAIAAASRNPRLLSCTQESLLKGVIEASTLGLDCSGLMGRGYMVPYKNSHLSKRAGYDVYEAQFQPGYLGLCDLARRSGEVKTVTAKAVFAADIFQYEEGLEPKLRHVPDMEAVRDDGDLRYVYAVATLANGERQFHVMTVREVEKHRARSRAKDSGPWKTDYVAMALKTVTRQLCKWLPQSPELARAIQADDEAEGWATDADAIIDVTPPAAGESFVDALAERIRGADDDGEAEARKPDRSAPADPPPPPPPEPEPTPEPEGESHGESASADAGPDQAERLMIAFREAAEAAGMDTTAALAAWPRFVKISSGGYPQDLTGRQWGYLAERMAQGFDPTQYGPAQAKS